MFRVITIGDTEVGMLAMASTDLYYRQIFGIDPLSEITGDNFSAAEAIEQMRRLGYIMAKQYELKDRKAMKALNQDTYLDWLDGFERSDIMAAIPEIRAIYNGQKSPKSTEKKTEEESTEK